jgi:hypothetical protein
VFRFLNRGFRISWAQTGGAGRRGRAKTVDWNAGDDAGGGAKAGSQEEPGGARRSPGGALEEPGGAQEEPGRARRSQEEPGRARRSQEEPGGARRSQEEPGGARRSQEQLRTMKHAHQRHNLVIFTGGPGVPCKQMWGSAQFLQGSPKTAASSCGLHPNFYRGPWGPLVNSGVGFPLTFTGVPGDSLSAAEGSPPIFAGVPGDPCQQWWGSLQFFQAAPRDPLRAEVGFNPNFVQESPGSAASRGGAK